MEDFAAIKEQLVSELQQLEAKRKELYAQTRKFLIVFIAVGIVGAIVALITEAFQFLIGGLVVGGIIYAIVASVNGNKYKKEFKQKVIPAIVRAIDPELKYQADNHITKSQFYESQIFKQRADKYSGEDYFSGMIGKTSVEFSELHAQERHTTTDSKGRTQTHYVTFFRGLFMIADFNKEFNGHTIVLPDTAEKAFGWLGKKLQSWNVSREDLIYLEDPEFEKEFVVYGSDQVEARYILATSMMRRILDLKKKFNCSIYLSFLNSNVYVAIYTNKNMLEPKLSESLLERDSVKKFYDQISQCVNIIDELNLNTRIWGKQ